MGAAAMTNYTDLCAQGEAALTTIKRLRKYDWQDWAAVDVEDAAQIVAGVPALIAAIRELEAQKRDLALDVLAASGQAQDAYEAQLAAEAKLADLERAAQENDPSNLWRFWSQKSQALADKLAEVEKERDEYQRQASKLQEEVMRLGRELNTARYGQPDFSWSIHKEAMAEMTARAEAAEATVASLKEQVEAMRGALKNIDALDPEKHIDGCSVNVLRGLVLRMGEIARAALTTENQTNG
jgi:chromosome segregation ATPase